MKPIQRQETERSPFVDFNFPSGRLALRGESYPEDAAAFFGPLMEGLESWLAGLDAGSEVQVDFELSYFNSSSAKALMNMLMRLDGAAKAGVRVLIRWHYAEDDDTMEEFGEDFAEDIEHATFELCPVEDD